MEHQKGMEQHLTIYTANKHVRRDEIEKAN
jgi:hypothetical protein